MLSRCILLSLSLLVSLACNKRASEAQETVPPAGLAGDFDHLQHKVIEQAQKKRVIWRGKVAEVIQKEGFSYLRINTPNNQEQWIALVNQTAQVNDDISIQEQAVLSDFYSRSLDRHFSKIIFGSLVPEK